MLKISIKHLNASNGCDALIYHSELWHNRIMTEKETLFRVFFCGCVGHAFYDGSIPTVIQF